VNSECAVVNGAVCPACCGGGAIVSGPWPAPQHAVLPTVPTGGGASSQFWLAARAFLIYPPTTSRGGPRETLLNRRVWTCTDHFLYGKVVSRARRYS